MSFAMIFVVIVDCLIVELLFVTKLAKPSKPFSAHGSPPTGSFQRHGGCRAAQTRKEVLLVLWVL
jgi:hypothetical protein